MKKLILAFSFLFAITSQAQIIQKVNTYGFEYKRLEVDSFLRISLDTLASAPDGSIAFLNHTFFVKDTIWKVIATPDGVTAVWGTIGGTIGDQTDLMSLLNAKVPKTTTLTIDGVAHDLSTDQSWGPFLNPVDTQWLHDQVVNVTTYTNSLTFSDGLHQAGNNIVALHDEAHWNANRFQGRFVATTTPLNGQVYAWDSVNAVWKPTTISGGGSQNLQSVTDIGATTTNNLTTGLISWKYSGTTIGNLTAVVAGGSNYGGALYLKSPETAYKSGIAPQQNLPTGDHLNYLPNIAGRLTDTLATLYDLRALGGGGGGGTSGIDDVLAIGQALTANRVIDLNTHALTIDNASSVTAGLQIRNSNTTTWFMPNSSTAQVTVSGNITDGVMQWGSNGFVRTPYYGFPTGSFHMNTGTFNGVAPFWNTTGQLIEKAAGATNIKTKTFSNNNNEVYPFEGTLLVNATGGNTNLILPDPDDGGFNVGAIMRFKKTDASANTVTIDAWTNWSSTVDGVHTKTLTAQYDDIVVQSDGTNWHVVGSGSSGGGGGGSSLPYQLASVYVTQSGTSVPTVTVLYNGVAGCTSITSSRAISGGGVPYYTITLNGISGAQGMTFSKTTVNGYMGMGWNGTNITSFPVGDGSTVNGYVWMNWVSLSTIEFYCSDAAGSPVEFSALFDSGQQLPFEIKIYP